ncbi:MAG: type IIS restriction endonuclease subunit R [Candidatus Parcubacteria bacterium]|nr:MAG: type IIS restriction endonuclease subunit R [Candidatus Parcubacteria bacterium]
MDQNKFLKYIFERIKREDYRGIHLSQHNRLPFDKVLEILKTINNIAGTSIFKIHIGDWKGKKQKGCETYYKIVDVLENVIEQGTVNSLKKNIFPDLDTMGFLNRYNPKGELVSPDKRETIDSVALTKFAVDFINEEKPRKQYKMYIEATEKLLEPILDELFYLLYKIFESINVYEYMFIVSDEKLSTQEKINLINSYRRLKKIQKIKVNQEILKIFKEINKKAINKKYKRDFGNWYNESLQIFNLLNQTVYFKTFRKTVLMLSISQEALEFIATRSQRQREKYFDWHNVRKAEGYQLHHICPLSYATTRRQLELIDNYKNLIYISDKAHSKIPHDLFIQLVVKGDRIFLINPVDKKSIDITDEIIIDTQHLGEMVQYNKKLLEKIG